MSNSVDNRIVQMKFDNASFEKNVQTSMNTLNKLNKSLELSESTKGLTGISDAAKRIDLSGLSNGLDTIGMKFSALQVMGVTALANITNAAVNAGKHIVSALTIDPIKTGLTEYETKINAIQVIKANTQGVNTMDQITAALDELNTYADQTIYNFAQMTSNVGKFVAQGLDVNQATQAIKGMANLAAASGASAEDMSRATYQMSQALGGTIKLIDWNSLRNANMATTTLKNTLIDLAKTKGIDIDSMIKSKGTFEQTLENGWLSGEMFSEAMNIYSDVYSEAELKAKGFNDEQVKKFKDLAKTAQEAATQVKTLSQLWGVLKETAQSGWTQSWEYIFGDFESAKKSFTQAQVYFSGIINASSDARNAVLKAWSDAGGRNMAIEALQNTFAGLLSVINPIKEAFKEIFPAITANQLLELTKNIRDFTKGLTLSEETSKDLKNTFKGLFAVLDIVGQALGAIIEAVLPLTGGIKDASGGVLSLTGSFGEFLVKLDETIKKTDFFRTIIKNMSVALQTGFNNAKIVIDVVLGKLAEFGDWAQKNLEFPGIEAFHNLLQRVHDRMSEIMHSSETLRNALNEAFDSLVSSAAFTTLTSGIEKFAGFLQALWKVIKMVGSGIADALSDMTAGMSESLGNADFNSIFDIVNGGLIAGFLIGLNKFMNGFGKVLDSVGKSANTFADIKKAVLDTFGAFQEQLKAGTLLKIAGAIALLTASLVVLSFIDSAKLTVSMAAITTLFVELMAAMTVFSKISGDSLKGLTRMTTVMIGMSVSILILASAMKTLSTLDWDGVAKGMVSIGGLMTMLVITAKVLSASSGKMMTGMTGLLIFTFAIRNLVGVVQELGSMDTDSLTRGLIGVGVLIAELAAFMVAAKFGKMGVGTGLGLIALATAINILATSVQIFGEMDTNALIQGLVALQAVLTELSLFIQVNSGAKGMIFTATGMVILGAAIQVLADAIAQLGYMSTEALIKGLTSMGIALGVVTLALNLMPKNMIVIGIGLIAVSTALLIMSSALTALGGMTWDEIARGLVALASSLGVIALAVNLMTGALAGAAALLVVSAALAIFAPTLVLLGTMSWEEIARGLTALAGAFAVLGIAAVILGPLVPVILGLAGAFVLIGVGIAATGVGLMAIGVGLSAVAAGFAALAVLGVAGATAVVAALTIIIEGIVSMIPFILTKIGEGIKAIAQVLIDGATAVVAVLTIIIEGIASMIPFILTKIGEGIKAIAPVLIDVATAVVAALTIIIEGIASMIPFILTKIGEGIIAIAQVLIDGATAVVAGLVELVPIIVDGVFVLLVAVLEAIVEYAPKIIEAALTIVVQLLQGLAAALPSIIQAGTDVMVAFIEGVAASSVRLVDAAFNAMIVFINGLATAIDENAPLLVEAMTRLINSLINAAILVLTNSVDLIKERGKDIMESGFIQGIKDKFEDTKTAIEDTISGMILSIKNKISDFKSAAGELINGFVQGIEDKFSDAVAAASDLGTQILDSAKKALGINSPSKEFAEIGMYSDLGLIQGLKAYAAGVYGAASDVAGGAVSAMQSSFNGVSRIIDDSMNLNPIIRPTLDLTDITNGARTISSMFNKQQVGVTGENGQNGGGSASDSSINYVQNNYSPKALSQTEIYRQTKNQLSTLKGVLGTK